MSGLVGEIAQKATKQKGRENKLPFPLCITVLFFLLSLNTILHHEMWRDELQAWLIARDSDSIAQLFFQNLRYEGHPGLRVIAR
jgi:hypothetical protein